MTDTNKKTVLSVAKLASESTKQPQSSQLPLFDSLAVALPDYVEPPVLKRLVTTIQEKMVVAMDTLDVEAATDNLALDNDDINRKSVKKESELHQANAILRHLETTPIAQASVLVAITHEPNPKVLLTRRAGHLNTHAGEVSFAGGKHDVNDGNNVVTALREASEETALPSNKVQVVGQLPIQVAKSGMSVRSIVVLVDPDVIYVPELGEIARIFWGELKVLLTQPTVDYQFLHHHNGEKAILQTPSFIIDNETVWGLTGRILASLLEVGFDRELEWYYRPINEKNSQ